jgi:putative nucleotidyltransferase with HDIG domain
VARRRFGLREIVRLLNEPPERVWPEGLVHHGVRAIMLLGLAVVVISLFPVTPVPDLPVLERGMVSEETIIAQVGFPIYKPDEDLARERAEAVAGVAPIFVYEPGAVDTMTTRVRTFMERVDSAAGITEEPIARAELNRLLQSYGFVAGEETIDALRATPQRTQLRRALEATIRTELPQGIASAGELDGSAATQLRLRRDGQERLVSRDSVRTAQGFFERAGRHLPRGASAEVSELQRLVLIRFFEPSIRLDRGATEAARERARQAVPAVKAEVLQGEKIIGAHEQVRDAEMERLLAYRDQLARLGELGTGSASRLRAAGGLLFSFSILLIFGTLLLISRRGVYHEFRHIVLVTSLILGLIVAAAITSRSGWPVEIVPIALPTVIVAALWDGRMALTLSLVLAILLAGQTPFLGLSPLYTLVLGGAAAGLGVRVVRRRAQTWVFVGVIAAAYILAAITLGLLRSRAPAEIITSAGWGVLNAIGSTLIAMGFLPLIESFTRITTDQRLLELSDMNHPLLQRLQREAVGTFSHTLNVANLAESAARAIGANALLTRVGTYYHDVGKVAKPQYFIENQPAGRNPHDKLRPATSAAIVRNHVLEGLRLADEAKLPDCVRAFIAEHHGTQAISFFYERARELDPDAEIDPRDFRYPGPRPQSRETAILMLADSVESAARVLHDPTPERIRTLIDRIVESKMAQRQLDDAPLTLGELTRIKEEFVMGLSGIHHQRIDYPATREETEAAPQAASGQAAGQAAGQTAGPTSSPTSSAAAGRG